VRANRLIDRYGEILLPELKERYGINLLDIFQEEPPFSPRYILAHIKHLPVESAFIAEVRGGRQFRGWGEDRYMQAALLNAVRAANYLFILANTDPKKKKPEAPEPWPLPDGKFKAKTPDKPGSFAFIARSLADKAKKRMEDGG
jgi:hypothetical protein